MPISHFTYDEMMLLAPALHQIQKENSNSY
jgi:hypothetical protein